MNEFDELEEGEPSWEVRTLKDAYAERPPTEYVVDKFFATHSPDDVSAP